VSSILRLLSFGAMLLSNSFMMTLFTKSMHNSTSFRATVATTSFNFSFSVFEICRISISLKIESFFCLQALLSFSIFGEDLPYQWWIGFTLIICGLSLLSTHQKVT
jgi:uncharacterized membrane protein